VNQYYVRVRGEVKGPWTQAQIQTQIRRKRIGRIHELSTDAAHWQKAGDMPELFEPAVSVRNRTGTSDQNTSLIFCAECSGQLSKLAKACPHCGAPTAAHHLDEAEPRQKKSGEDASVFAEPWMEDILHPQDVHDPGAQPLSDHVSEDQSVWDEPGLSAALAGETPPDAVTWYRWYMKKVDASSGLYSWLATLVVVLTSGVFAVVGTFAAQVVGPASVSSSVLIAITVVGPATEELMKIALTLWMVEKRPWLYRNGVQILLCALASGAAFAAVENILYLKVYVPNPPPGLAEWRWTVCVLLHSGCSTISGIGAWKIWRQFQQQQRAPVLTDGAGWIFAAIVIHGTYNGTVTVMELSGFGF